MAKQLNVSMNFNANTQQAKAAITDLQNSLNKIATGQINIDGLDPTKITQASHAAQELSIHLQSAFNSDIGNLDLHKLDQSLRNSGTNISALSRELLSAGQTGQQAFVQLAQSIAAADRPLVTINSKLREFGTTLANTARWQISSSILHGFMGAVQNAYSYAQDLNESLNEIRIVTGQSTDQMAKFAKEANKAAKELSTTTTEFTNASLIFYQQGLSDSEVLERTTVATKMANASGESIEKVADQMTAVWNNFDDGTKSLEYYGDVMTALGAATASSTDEIAGGLEKFAAIGDTIGLSYEYAASALATITSNTRQSEEVVGTALKTIFARIQGLKLGETLEDGTSLNKYSEALSTVGISIFDASGELKAMDSILDEMAATWDTLSKKEQAALAQTVAGVRQYTQLVSLMENWDNGDNDSMVANLDTAYNAEGELNKQADIYAESWEAASDRARASMESIFSQLLDDEFFIDITNGFATMLDSISSFIEGMGGIKPLLIGLGSILLKMFAGQIEPALQRMRANLEVIFTGSSKTAERVSKEMRDEVDSTLKTHGGDLSAEDKQQLISAQQMSAAKDKILAVEKQLTPLEKQRYEFQLEILQKEQENVQSLIKENEEKKKAVNLAKEELALAKNKLHQTQSTQIDMDEAEKVAGATREAEETSLKKKFDKKREIYQQTGSEEDLTALIAAKEAWTSHMDATEKARYSLESFMGISKQAYDAEMQATQGHIASSDAVVNVSKAFDGYIEDLNKMLTTLDPTKISETKNALVDIESALEMASGGVFDFKEDFANLYVATDQAELASGLHTLIEKLKQAEIPAQDLEKILSKLGQGDYVKSLNSGYDNVNKSMKKANKSAKELEESTKKLRKAQEQLNKKFDAFDPKHKAKAIESFTKAASGLGQVASAASSLRSAFAALNNEDMDFGEKMTSMIMGLTMAIPMLISGLNGVKTGFLGLMTSLKTSVALQKAAALSMVSYGNASDFVKSKLTAQQIAERTGLTIDQATVVLNQAKAKAMLEEGLAHDALGGKRMKRIIAEKLGITVEQAGIIMQKMKTGLTFEQAAAEEGLNLVKSKGILMAIGGTASKLTEAISTKAKTIADKAETGGMLAKAASYIAAQAAAFPLLAVTLLIVAAIAALVAVVLLVVAAFKAWQASTPEAKLAAAKEESARLAEELNKAKEASDALKQSIEGYDTAVDKLKTLTKGTQEYRDAVAEANEKARELIDAGGLEGKYGFNAETGLIEFQDGALEEAQEAANKKVATVQAQKLMADNNVITSQQAVDNKKLATEGSDKTYIGAGVVGAAAVLQVIPVIGQVASGIIAVGAGLVAAGQAIADNKQTKALEKLQEAYIASDGNMVEAMNTLTFEEKALVESLGKTDAELQELCEASRANTQAIIENNKQIVDANFAGNEDYDNSKNKEFLNEIMAVEMTDETERLYEEKYKDKAGGMTDADAQKAYAELMGWDANLVENKNGNKAVYIDNEGNEVTISDEQVRRYLAQNEAIQQLDQNMSEYADNVDTLASHEKQLAKQYANGTITYDQYVASMKAMGATLDMSAEDIDSYIEKHSSNNIQRRNKEVALADNLYGKMGMDADATKAYMEKLTKDMSDEELEIAVNVAASADTLDEFKREFEIATTDALISSIEASQSSIADMLAAADEAGSFSQGDFELLENDENFQKWLEENNKTMLEITSATYTEQYNIISQFYSDLSTMQQEALEEQKENYQSDLAEYQAIIDYKMAAEAGAVEQQQAIVNAWGTGIDFEAYMDMDISELQEKLAEAQAGIEEITQKEYEISMSWDGIDQLEGSFDEMADFAGLMEKDVKKVGDRYQMTAAQGKKWMQMYPELFSTASVTTDGLIELTEAEYQAFAEAEKAKRDEAIQTEIDNLQLRLDAIPEEKARLEQQLHMYKTLAEGKMDIENASAEDLIAVRANLAQFYIDSGVDEATANAEALKAMGLDQAEYNKLVATATEENANNVVDGTQKTVQNIKTMFHTLLENLKTVFKAIGEGIAAFFKGETYDWSNVSSAWNNAWDTFKKDKIAIETGTMDTYKIGNNYTGYESKAKFEEAQANNLNEIIEKTEEALSNLSKEEDMLTTKITYLEALKNQDVSEFGSEDPNDVDETEDEKDRDTQDLIEIAERYHEINEEIEALEHNLSLVAKQKDRAFGTNRLKAMQQEIDAMEELTAKQEELYTAQKVFLALDQQKVQNTFANATFDEDGNISNYSALQQQAANELNAARTIYNNSAQEDADKEALEEAEKIYEEKIKILEQYEETLDATRESEEALQDAFDDWQAANFEMTQYKLELKLEINDEELQKLDYYLGKTEDDFFQRAEGMALMSDQLGVYTDNLGGYQENFDELTAKFKAGEISEADYMEGLKDIEDGVYDNLQSLNELDKEMMHYYGETLEMAAEEIDKVTSRMEHQTQILDHYQSLMDIMGKSTDYKKVGVVLEGKSKTLKNEFDAAKAEYDLFLSEVEEKKNLLAEAIASGDQAAIELYQQQYDDALAKADEAQEEYLSKAEEYAESLRAILENSLNEYAQTLENALTGDTSFDQMTSKMERAASLQEEYLTTTNKIYETNKLMNQAQQEIDKSTNSVAQRRLKQFISETNELQKKNKLSQFELEIQQAKYELLLAEIALEEAQDAKSTVRLQRDSEGNFGYVYTADQSKIDQAQQELADAQNSLYNIALEGANEYTEKYQQTLNEMYDTLTDLQQQYLDGAFESESEYQKAVEEAKEYYYAKLEEYSSLHAVALSTDARVVEDAWSSEFNTMVDSTQDWKVAVEGYVGDVTEAFRQWDSEMDSIAGMTGLGKDLSNLSTGVEAITTESDNLLKTLTDEGGLIDAIGEELNAVDATTASYAAKRQGILDLITTYEDLAAAILEVRAAAAGENDNSGGGSGGSGGGEKSGQSGGSGNDDKAQKEAQAKALAESAAAIIKGVHNGSIANGKNGWKDNARKAGYSEEAIALALQAFNDSKDGNGYSYCYEKALKLVGLDTGGYTGAWGSYGKLAMLHEKELVLNKQDTENLLSSVELLDSIIKTIDLQSANSQLGGLLSSPSFGNLEATETLEQSVTIEANFPNAQSRTEIEEAFTTLINRASQYANRK